MCGRYFEQRGPSAIASYFETVNPIPNHPASWNVAPTQTALVVRRHPETGARHLDPLRWGLVPRWSKDPAAAAKMINARAESVAEKPAYREAFRRRRCLVPIDGFYEWHQAVPKGPKQAYAVARANGEPMALAGLWEGWRDPAGPKDGEVLRTFTVVTGEANPKLAALHARMPVILAREDWPLWLGEVEGEAEAVAGLLRPCPPEWLAAWPVGARVNKVTENDAALLDRDPAAVALPGLDDPPPALPR